MTRDELTTYVLERLGVGSSRTAFVTQIQNHSYREYVKLVGEFELAYSTADLILTADDPLVDLPDDFLRMRSIRIGARAINGPSTFENVNAALAYRDQTDSSGAATSSYLFFSPTQLYLDPPPSESDNAGGQIIYVPKPAAWTLGSDEPEWLPEEFHDLIGEAVVWRMALNQEEFGTHAPAAQQNVSLLRAQLTEHLVMRRGDSSNRIRRRVYG